MLLLKRWIWAVETRRTRSTTEGAERSSDEQLHPIGNQTNLDASRYVNPRTVLGLHGRCKRCCDLQEHVCSTRHSRVVSADVRRTQEHFETLNRVKGGKKASKTPHQSSAMRPYGRILTLAARWIVQDVGCPRGVYENLPSFCESVSAYLWHTYL